MEVALCSFLLVDLGCRYTWEGAGIKAEGGQRGQGLLTQEPMGGVAVLTGARCGGSEGPGMAPGGQLAGPRLPSSCQVAWSSPQKLCGGFMCILECLMVSAFQSRI